MKRFLPELAGNDALRRELAGEFAAGNPPHAYIIAGPQGSGKHTLARGLAMAAACTGRGENDDLPCGRCEACRKIREGLSPDVVTLSRTEGRATIGVDAVRALRDDLSVRPNDLDLKIDIIEDAHTLTVQAQNALLLSLEEPPCRVLFLLLCEQPEALLETVRSRAPVLRMQPLDDAALRAFLLAPERPPERRRAAEALAARSPAEFDVLVKSSDGWAGVAEALLDEKARRPILARRERARALLDALAARRRDEATLAVLGFGTARDEVTAQLLCLSRALRDLTVLRRAEDAPLCFFSDREGAADLAARFPTERLPALAGAVDDALDALAANAHVYLTLTRLAGRLTA